MMYDVVLLHLNFDIMLISYTGTQIEKPAGRSTKSKPKCLKFSLLLINLISPTSLLDYNKSNSITKKIKTIHSVHVHLHLGYGHYLPQHHLLWSTCKLLFCDEIFALELNHKQGKFYYTELNWRDQCYHTVKLMIIFQIRHAHKSKQIWYNNMYKRF